MKVVVLLDEAYSPVCGGALSTWTYQVYNLLSIDVKVIAKPANDCYDFPSILICRSNLVVDWVHTVIRNRSFKGILNPLKRWLRSYYSRRAASLCRSLKPDVIHIHNRPQSVLPVRRLNPQARIILHMNNDHLIEGISHNQNESAKVCQAADRIAFCSEYLRKNALEKIPTLAKEKTFLIPNGADESFIASSLRPLENDPRLLFVGRIVPDKGLHILLESLEDVFNIYPQATLRIVGGVKFGSYEEDDYLKSVRLQASVWGSRVVFVGPVPHDQIATEFAQADLFVCPSIWNDPLPTVNAEAMACGLPIVAFARGGIPEMVGDAGVLVHDVSAKNLAKAINTVLGDFDLRQRLSQHGIERVATKFSWQVISKIWLQKIQAVYKEPLKL